jgi:hypothetical protein
MKKWSIVAIITVGHLPTLCCQSYLKSKFNRHMYIGGLVKHSAKPWKTQNTGEHWEYILSSYKRTAPLSDVRRLRDYLGYYRSWYQAVTPAPKALYESLSPEARAVANQLKEYAQRFVQPHTGIPGATTLSKEGNAWYQTVLSWLHDNATPKPTTGLSRL